MSSLGAFKNPATYHLLSYGTLLGSTLFQSFIAGIVAYRVLPRPQFSTLQKHTFPVYFALQTAAPAALALTYPRGPLALLPRGSFPPRAPDRLAALLISAMFVAGLLNLALVGPETTKVMVLRKHQETRDRGKKGDGFPGAFPKESGEVSAEMAALNRRFGILHGVSTLVNLVGLGAMVWYGGVLGGALGL